MATSPGKSTASRPRTEDLSRADVYARLSSALAFPDPTLHGRVAAGEWPTEIAAELDGLPYRLRTHDLAWSVPDDYDEMQSEYIRIFQIGGRQGPPCPLHEGQYTRDRSHTLQHAIRFYNYFKFRLDECVMPDHATIELEFMSHLAGRGVSDQQSLLRAQRDFLKSHLSWLSTLAGRVARTDPPRFYGSLVKLTARLVAADGPFIKHTLGGYRDV
jgi:DMSO reductase family type II enzyme chaperone